MASSSASSSTFPQRVNFARPLRPDVCARLNSKFTVHPPKRMKQKTNIVQCYLFYGLNEYERMRFYPEYLTTIIPRFFKKDDGKGGGNGIGTY